MKTMIATLLSLMLSVGISMAQNGTAGTPANSNPPATVANTQGGSSTGSAMAASNDLRILSPKLGEKIGSSDVDVRYELTNTNADAAASPTYRVQLDGHDASETLDTEYDFTGLAPGPHTFTVELVDANHTPIPGSQAVVHFTTFLPGADGNKAAPGTSASPNGNAKQPSHPTALLQPQPPPAGVTLASRKDLPNAGGELPLLSMVGFGVLVGGVISAIRSRKQ